MQACIQLAHTLYSFNYYLTILFILLFYQPFCDCGCFYEYQSPCAHGIAAAMYRAEDPLSFFYDAYSTGVYRKTYSHPLPPISIEDLAVDNNIKPPVLRKQAGRPRTKRIRKGAWERKQTRCSNCLGWGHNKRSCRGQPVSSGRRERARDWLDEVEVSSDRDDDDDIHTLTSSLAMQYPYIYKP